MLGITFIALEVIDVEPVNRARISSSSSSSSSVCVWVGETVLLLTSMFAFDFPLHEQVQSNWNFNTVCRMVSIRCQLVIAKLLSLETKLCWNAPGEWIYKKLCRLPTPCLLTMFLTQTEFASLETLESSLCYSCSCWYCYRCGKCTW